MLDFAELELSKIKAKKDSSTFNFCLSNGMQTGLNEGGAKLKAFTIDTENDKVRRIDMYHNTDHLFGMILFDADGEEIYSLGKIEHDVIRIDFAADEKIIGFRYQFHPAYID